MTFLKKLFGRVNQGPKTWMGVRQQLKNSFKHTMSRETQAIVAQVSQTPLNYPRIADSLTTSDPQKRCDTAAILSSVAMQTGSSEILNMLLIGLSDTNRDVRMIVSPAFGANGYSPAVNGLIRMMKSGDSEEIELASYCLCGIGENAVPALLKLMAEGEGKNKATQEAASALYNMGPDVVDWLIATFYDKDSENYMWAIPILAKYPKQIQQLTNLVYKDDEYNPILRIRVVQAMGILGSLGLSPED